MEDLPGSAPRRRSSGCSRWARPIASPSPRSSAGRLLRVGERRRVRGHRAVSLVEHRAQRASARGAVLAITVSLGRHALELGGSTPGISAVGGLRGPLRHPVRAERQCSAARAGSLSSPSSPRSAPRLAGARSAIAARSARIPCRTCRSLIFRRQTLRLAAVTSVLASPVRQESHVRSDPAAGDHQSYASTICSGRR